MCTCSKCGAAVQIVGALVVRECKCDAPVVASMKATASGVAKVC